MILAINTVSAANNKNKVEKFKTSPINTANPPLQTNSLSQTNYLNFSGIKNTFNDYDDFAKTVEYNYFSLPKVTLDDGTKYQIKPDKFQLECAQKLYNGDNTIFEASTGAGKTAVAHYAINKNLYDDKKTIVTVPLISLANDKYREFCNIYGEENVGLLTGSNKINPEAPIVVMITEILRNQTEGLEEKKDEIGTIIFDEAHYIGDSDRGAVWENSIINAVPKGIQTLYLSATLGNGKDFNSWIENLNPTQKVSRVEADVSQRLVPLTYSVYDPKCENKFASIIDGNIDVNSIDSNNLSDRQKRALEEIFKTENNKSEFYEMSDNEYGITLKNLQIKLAKQESYKPDSFKTALNEAYPSLSENQTERITQFLLTDKSINKIHVPPLEHDDFPTLVEDLKADNKLPALVFKLSQKGCDDIIRDLDSEKNGVDLTTDDEKEQIQAIIDKYREKNIYLGTKFDEGPLLKGFASHHAGKLPGYRKLVEELFSKKLIKVVSATSTLSAGINMPVRTVVIGDVTYKKYNPKTKIAEFTTLSASEFHQMAGRAGRRGIDPIGHVVLYNLFTDENGFFDDEVDVDKKGHNPSQKTQVPKDKLNFAYELIETSPDALRSSFKPEPCMMAQYYAENKTNDNLKNEIDKSFRVHISKNPDKEVKSLYKKFENYSTILAKQGYIEKNYKNEITLTPKGKMLQHAMGANPMVLTSLIYDKKLNGGIKELCQIAGYISNTSNQEENSKLQEVISQRMSQVVDDSSNNADFQNTNAIYQDIEQGIIKSTLEARVNPNDITYSDSFGALVGYMWAYCNEKNPHNSIENFEFLINNALKPMDIDFSSKLKDPEFKAKADFNRKAKEGNIYKTLSQSISVLKQIERIADFALEHEIDYPDREYYETLKYNAQSAVKLMQKQPISDEAAV